MKTESYSKLRRKFYTKIKKELSIVYYSDLSLIIITLIGIPLLTLIGYIHFKRSIAYRAETEIAYESNPFARRTLVNTELMMKLNLHLTRLLIKLNQNEKLTEKEMIELTSLQDDLSEFLSERTFANDKDLDYIKKLRKS